MTPAYIAKITAKEKRLFIIRLLILASFAFAALALGVFTKEMQHITLGIVGMKFLDSAGEALSEALAAGAESA